MVEARLRKMVERWPTVSGYRLNPDPTVVDGIVKGLVRSSISYGYPYCPCRDLSGDAETDKDSICPCKWHHEEIRVDQHCRCQLFVGEGYDPAVAYRAEDVAVAAPASRPVVSREVTVYLTSWCFLSRRTRAFLDKHGIPHTCTDIEEDEDAALRVEEWTGGFRSVPTVLLRQIVTEPGTAVLQRMLVDSRAAVLDAEVFKTATCPQCSAVAGWLDQHGIAYRAVSLEDDEAARERVMAWNGGFASVPTLDLQMLLTEPTAAQLSAAMGL